MIRGLVAREGRLVWTEAPRPAPGPGEVRIRVRATAVNRADLLQRAGRYDPPPGASPVLGLECAGTVEAVGEGAGPWAVGDRVCALLTGGGYATEVVVPAGQLLPAGDLPFERAAALPEALCTAHDALVVQGGLRTGERVLIHAGASGVGTLAIQLCARAGAPCFVTAGSPAKIDRCLALGAEGGVDRHRGDWSAHPWVRAGVDLVLDPVGQGYLGRELRVLRTGGRVLLIGLLGGRTETIDLGRLLVKRQRIQGTVLRSRGPEERAAVVRRVRQGPWADVLSGRIEPVIHQVLPLDRAEEAHALLASNATVGKVVLTVGETTRHP